MSHVFKPDKIQLLAPCNEVSEKTGVCDFCSFLSLPRFEEGCHRTGGAGELQTQACLPFFGREWKIYLLTPWL